LILTGVEVSGCGRFRETMRLVGLDEGVNVLAAPNEAGKSTLFKAVRTCIFERHSAKGRTIEALGTQNADLPLRIAVDFRRDGKSYRVEKTFLRSVRAILWENGREIARDRAADDKVWDILGLSGGGRGGLDDPARFGLLWVGQTKSFALDAPTQGATDDLNRLIAAEVGELVGGERARAVLAKVKGSLRELETDSGKPKTGGAWRIAADRCDELRQRRDELGRQIATLDGDFRDLDSTRAELARHNDPTVKHALTANLLEARKDLERGRSAAELLRRRDAEARAARAACSEIEGRLRRLSDDAKRVDDARAALAELGAKLGVLEGASGKAREALSQALATSQIAEDRLGASTGERANLQRLEQAIESQDLIGEWTARRDEARGWDAAVKSLSVELATLAVEPRLLDRAEALAGVVQRLRAKREASAPRLSLTLGPDAGDAVRLDGRIVSEDASHVVLGPTTIAIGSLVTVAIAPAGMDDSSRLELGAAEREFDEVLASLGVSSLGEAKARSVRATDVTRERNDLRGRLAGLAKSLSAADGLEALDARIAAARARVAQALDESGMPALPERGALQARKEEAAAAIAGIEAERRRVQAAVEAARRADQDATAALIAAKTRHEELSHGLNAALAAAPDATRADDLARLAAEASLARDREAAALDAFEAQRRATPDEDGLADLAARVLRLEQAVENDDLKRQTLEKRIASLEEAVSRQGGLGLGEEHDVVCADLDMAERDLSRREDEVAALRLIRATIEDTLAESRERYLAPVRRHVRPFLHALFPGSDLAFSEDFRPLGLDRDGSMEAHDLLSDGTREQIAVLVRLALANLLSENGEPVPIILDDALVFSDDERMDRMFDALSRASRSQQVIVLTCRSRAFGALGGRMLAMESARSELPPTPRGD
jgi:DNA repair exonuclease SbcCD ATPase subunit